MVIVPYKRREIRLLNSGRPSESFFFIIQSVDTGKHTKQARAAVNEFIVGILCTLVCYINTYKRLSYLLQNLFFHNSNFKMVRNRSHARISPCAAIARMIHFHCARLSPTTPYCAASSPSEDLSASRKTPADNPSAFSARFHGNNSHTSATCVAI